MFKLKTASLRAAAALCFLLILAACGTSSSTSVSAVSITTSALPGGTVGTVYSASISAVNGTQPYSFVISAGTLPAGLSLSAAGTLAGVPAAAAAATFTVTVQDGTGKQATASYTLVIAPGTASTITLSPSSLTGGTVSVPYTVTFAAAGGTAPYIFSAGAGIPPGLALSATGVLSGTPTAAGTFGFSVSVTDSTGLKVNTNLRVVIAPTPVSLTTTSLPPGNVSSPYSTTFAAANGTKPYSFSISTGSLPANLTLSSGGVISGTPTTAGTFNFTVQVTDATSGTASAPYTLTIAATAAPLTLGPATLPSATVNMAYSTNLQLAGGTPPYALTLVSGSYPPGITVSTDGTGLAGTPTLGGAYTFTLRATDSASPQQTISTTFYLNVLTATVTIDTTTVLATVPQTFFGLHTSVYDTSLNDTAKLPALLQTTGITTLRYPGGNYSDRYHWSNFGVTPPHASTPPVCNLNPQDVFLGAGADFGSFVKTLLATGTQGIITVNYGTSVSNSTASLSAGSNNVPNHCSEPNTAGQPEEAAAWVAYANGLPANTHVIGVDATGFDWKTVGFWAALRAAGPIATDDGYNFLRIAHPAPVGIQHWEIGNEVYYNGWSNNLNPETDLHAPYLYSGQYDNASFASRASNPLLSPTAYGQNAGPFITAMKAVDPTILIGVDFASPGATDPIDLSWNPSLAQSVCTASAIDLAIIHYYPGTYNAVMPSELLSLPQSDLPRQIAGIKANLAQYCPANASAIQFWLTETSPNGTLAPNFPAPVIGLFTLNEELVALQQGVQNIDWLELHNGSYLDESENPGPSYFGIQLAHLVAAPGDSVVTANSSSATVLSFATKKTNGQKGILLLNADPANPALVQVTVSGSTVGATATQYSFGNATNQSTPTLTGTPYPVAGSTFTVTVPSYTATALLLQ